MSTTRREYHEDYELDRYLRRNYNCVLTDREHALRDAAVIESKARHVRSAGAPESLRSMPGYFFDADVAAIVETGFGLFDRKCCERVLRDYADQIHINRCERCNRIVASPIACACLWCGHHWYDRRPEMMLVPPRHLPKTQMTATPPE